MDRTYITVHHAHEVSIRAVNYSTARAALADTMDGVCADHEPVIITRSGSPSVVMVSLEDYSALAETAQLLRTPANAKRLMDSIHALEAGQGPVCALLP